jgi:hypothetical protein
LKIEDWEIGALFWNCLTQSGGDENAANQLVREKYFDTFTSERDLCFFLGTTRQFHNVARNPFIIVGVFYPPRSPQDALFWDENAASARQLAAAGPAGGQKVECTLARRIARE